ncbi:hypothetical protein G7077_03675 [Sphingomonas piscis]|uniref:Uncharacterized protein n=1 Tax=Sphingomonas piscis TaxID=2714943 RepID=A0A6G7YN32_9SPHN|nr:hypothetical protein [Sphingomonas piscis]QIK78144.1 hypothetical protein G7077_03675 [Sphingomonas piscis]
MPTSFLGLFLVSTALSLAATFTVLGLRKLVRTAYPPRRRPIELPRA